MNWFCSKKEKPLPPCTCPPPQNEMYLSPPVKMVSSLTDPNKTMRLWNIGLDKKEQKLYYCEMPPGDDEMLETGCNYYVRCPVVAIDTAPGNAVVCEIDSVKFRGSFLKRFQRLESGNISIETFINDGRTPPSLWLGIKPKRKFVPQGNADFDKLAVLFDVAKV